MINTHRTWLIREESRRIWEERRRIQEERRRDPGGEEEEEEVGRRHVLGRFEVGR